MRHLERENGAKYVKNLCLKNNNSVVCDMVQIALESTFRYGTVRYKLLEEGGRKNMYA